MSRSDPAAESAASAPPVYFDARADLAARFITGAGIEIGPLHMPLPMPAGASARYVDRMSVEELRTEYPELADWDLTPVDVIDDGERLATIADGSQDFVAANHFLEHTEDPIGTIETHLAKLKPGGILFYAVPDMRYTFDFRREPTPLDHMIRDHDEGPEGSRRGHYEEWARLVDDPDAGTAPVDASAGWEEKADKLESAAYSIHMHVWTQAEFLGLILHCRERTGGAFDIEVAARQAYEFIVVLRKSGGFPPGPGGNPSYSARVRELERAVHDLTTSPSWRITAPLRRAKRALRRSGGD